jgi:hypothetical protein
MSFVVFLIAGVICVIGFVSVLATLRFYKPKTWVELVTGSCGLSLFITISLLTNFGGLVCRLLGLDPNEL